MLSPVEEIKSRIDIVDLLSEYIQLKPAGTNFKANCPFHQEKTPSFMVSRDKQFWKCFGCNAGGDIFEFIKKIEGVEFPEALKILAGKAGVQLEMHNPELQSKRTRILNINEWATSFFLKHLEVLPSDGVVKKYFFERKINEISVQDFKIGFAPRGQYRNDLHNFLKIKKFTDEELVESGLILKSNRGAGFYDRFADRIMFPITDHNGAVVGFTGRILPGADDGQGKYVNTPETLVYKKSHILYGLYRAKTAMREASNAVVVEGNMDVITSHFVGVTNVVASSGTALTEDQLKLISRYTHHLTICFDADSAGQSAAERGVDLAVGLDLDVKVVAIPEGKDPDDFIKATCDLEKRDGTPWQNLINSAVPYMEYLLTKNFQNISSDDISAKKQATKKILSKIKMIPTKVEQSHWLQKLAIKLNVNEKFLWESLSDQKPASNFRPKRIEREVPAVNNVLRDKATANIECLLSLALHRNKNLDYLLSFFPLEVLPAGVWREFYGNIAFHFEQFRELAAEVDFRKVLKEMPLLEKGELSETEQNLQKEVERLVLFFDKEYADFSEEEVFAEMKNLAKKLKKDYNINQRKLIEQNILELQKKQGDEVKSEIARLSAKFHELTDELHELE